MAIVLITGCSSGFGLEAALAFAARGDTTYASMRNPAKSDLLLERAKEQGVTIELIALDVTDDDSVSDAVAAIEVQHGAVDVLVNNAGVGYPGSVETIDWSRARTLIETNFWGPIRLIRAVVPAMRSRRAGTIVNVSSVLGRMPGTPHAGFYTASKYALGALSESLAFELGPLGIRVACIEPGVFATGFWDSADFTVDLTDPYGPDQAWFYEALSKMAEAAPGPAAVADAILRAAHDPTTPVHNLVGDDAVTFMETFQGLAFEDSLPAITQVFESISGPRPSPAP